MVQKQLVRVLIANQRIQVAVTIHVAKRYRIRDCTAAREAIGDSERAVAMVQKQLVRSPGGANQRIQVAVTIHVAKRYRLRVCTAAREAIGESHCDGTLRLCGLIAPPAERVWQQHACTRRARAPHRAVRLRHVGGTIPR